MLKPEHPTLLAPLAPLRLRSRDRSRDLASVLPGSLLFLVFLIVLFPIGLSGNEEMYFGLAHRFVEPVVFAPHHALFFNNSFFFVFNFLAGNLIVWLDYENSHVILRVLQALLYAAGVAFLLRAFGVRLATGLWALIFFISMERFIPGGEWLFRGVEAKTFAYSLIFFSLGFMVGNRWKSSVGAAVLATYLHFLVGGFWALFVFAFFMLLHPKGRHLKFLGAYLVLTLPFFFFVALDHFGGPPARAVAGPDADFVYSFLRHPHHTAPFLPSGELQVDWLVRILPLAAIFLLIGAVLPRIREKPPRALAIVLLGVSVYLVLALVLSWFDRGTGTLGKFYLFRPAALSLFLSLLLLLPLVRRFATAKMAIAARRAVAAGLAALVALVVVFNTAKKLQEVGRGAPDPYREAALAVQKFTKPGDLVIVPPRASPVLPRELGRPTLVDWKFVPSRRADIYRWFEHLAWYDRLASQGCRPEVLGNIPVKAILVLEPAARSGFQGCGKLVWSNQSQALFSLREQTRGAAGNPREFPPKGAAPGISPNRR